MRSHGGALLVHFRWRLCKADSQYLRIWWCSNCQLPYSFNEDAPAECETLPADQMPGELGHVGREGSRRMSFRGRPSPIVAT